MHPFDLIFSLYVKQKKSNFSNIHLQEILYMNREKI